MKTSLETVEFNADLLSKYDRPLPRYTSYPPATETSQPQQSDSNTAESQAPSAESTSSQQNTATSQGSEEHWCKQLML